MLKSARLGGFGSSVYRMHLDQAWKVLLRRALNRAVLCTRMAGEAMGNCPNWDTHTKLSEKRLPLVKTCCPRSTALLHCSSVGCWEPIKVVFNFLIWIIILTNSPSGSIAGLHVRAASFFTAWSSKQRPLAQCMVTTSSEGLQAYELQCIVPRGVKCIPQ